MTPRERYDSDPEYAAMVDSCAERACMTVDAVLDGIETLKRSLDKPFKVTVEDVEHALADERRPIPRVKPQPPVPPWARKR